VASHTSVIAFFFYCFADPRDLHSFPTRRSSDLARPRLSGPSAPGIRNSGRPRTTRSEPCCGARSGTYRAEGGRAPPAGGAEQEKSTHRGGRGPLRIVSNTGVRKRRRPESSGGRRRILLRGPAQLRGPPPHPRRNADCTSGAKDWFLRSTFGSSPLVRQLAAWSPAD